MTNTTTTGSDHRYLMTSAGREAQEDSRLTLLEAIFDPTTQQRLEFVKPGWRCLEVAAGRGSITAWLADRVGPKGEVVASDLDPQHLQWLKRPNVRIVQHNILTDPMEALGTNAFDLVHARLLLQHLSKNQEAAIRRMAGALCPGGWLVIEDLDSVTMASADAAHPLAARFDQLQTAGIEVVRASGAIDVACGRNLLAMVERAGLRNVRHESHARIERGGGTLGKWYIQSIEGTRAIFAGRGAITHDGLNTMVQAFSDPTFHFMDAVQHVVYGQR